MYNADSLIKRLVYYAEEMPSHHALVSPGVTLSYKELVQLIQLQAQKLKDIGVSNRSVVGIKCADDIQHLLLCLAVTSLGAASCTIPTHEVDDVQNTLISRCNVTHVLDKSIAINFISSAPVSYDGIDLSQIAKFFFSTSGTTGEAKLVVHYDTDLVAQAHRHINSNQERFACIASIEHNFAKRHRLYCLAAGATNVFFDTEQATIVAQCKSLNVNVLHVSAFQAQELLAMPDINTLPDIRLKLGGSHVSPAIRQQLRDNITHNLQAGYGTTETGAIAFTDANDSNAGASVGQALPGIHIRAVTPERKPLAIGKRGELAIRCKGMFRGYLHKPELTASRLDNGWFYTGDIGYLDEQQRIYLCGRSDDMFVFNSMNIYPQDIEAEICQHPDIVDAVVLPKPSSIHGNIPIAFIVLAEKVKPDLPALKKFIRKKIGVRSPRQLTIVDKIPRNTTGKISRREAEKFSAKSEQIRSLIVQALDSHLTSRLKPAVITGFENGDTDIALRNIGIDSLARMDLLIALETECNTVITLKEFVNFRSLGDIAAYVLSGQTQHAAELNIQPLAVTSQIATGQTKDLPYIVKLFQRVFHYCHTVAQLHKALSTLECRLTPIDIECLYQQHLDNQLIPPNAATKFQTSINDWFQSIRKMMSGSGKTLPEPFVLRRIAPTVTHFVGPGSHADKTLLICFSLAGGGHLMMPNAVLMQHTDSAHYDLLIIAEPLLQAYWSGVPFLGENVPQVMHSIAELALIKKYKHIRTLGCSAGGYPAVVAGYLLGAEMAVSVGGRFHSERYLIRILNRIFTTWRAVRKGRCAYVLMSYSIDNNRDRRYAELMAGLSGASRLALEFTDGKIGHGIFQRLAERGELTPYLARTIFIDIGNELMSAEPTNYIMSLPANKIRLNNYSLKSLRAIGKRN